MYSLAIHLVETLKRAGYELSPRSKVLDFGCGSGGLVYEFRDLGYDAYGFDIHDRVRYRTSDDRAFFGFVENPQTDTSNALISPGRFRIPFGDDTFDAIFSTSVIEHVMDLRTAAVELGRVTKPTGVTLHTYPRYWTLVEPHTYVPFGGAFQSWLYFYFWALLGVRNEFQGSFSAKQTADNNLHYVRTGLIYHKRRELHQLLGEGFSTVRDVSQAWLNAPKLWSPWKILTNAWRQPYPLRYIALHIPLEAVMTANKRSTDALCTTSGTATAG
jgi:SAM-dependent methyltransferase